MHLTKVLYPVLRFSHQEAIKLIQASAAKDEAKQEAETLFHVFISIER